MQQIGVEPESGDLAGWLDAHGDMPRITPALAEVELPPAIRALAPDGLSSVPAVLAQLNRFEIDALIRATAAPYDDPTLRSLDAIHPATHRSSRPTRR